MELKVGASIGSGFKLFFSPLGHNRASYSGTNIDDSMTTEEGDCRCRGYISLVQSRAPSSSPDDWSSSSNGTSSALGAIKLGCSRESSMMAGVHIFEMIF